MTKTDRSTPLEKLQLSLEKIGNELSSLKVQNALFPKNFGEREKRRLKSLERNQENLLKRIKKEKLKADEKSAAFLRKIFKKN